MINGRGNVSACLWESEIDHGGRIPVMVVEKRLGCDFEMDWIGNRRLVFWEGKWWFSFRRDVGIFSLACSLNKCNVYVRKHVGMSLVE